MRIENIQQPLVKFKDLDQPVKTEGTGFANILRQAIQDVNDTQKTADVVAEEFSLGKINNVHEVTVATEQARLALELTIAVRNKVVETYKEIMRMQF